VVSDDRFTVEESAALLHAIFPNYPDIHGMKSAPETGAFLLTLRAGEPISADRSSCTSLASIRAT
jgi:hypothetical protein